MKIIKLTNIDNLKISKKDRVITIGNFDGLHLGHKELLKELEKESITKTLITFETDPEEQEIENFRYLTKLDLKLEMISKYNINEVILLNYQNIKNIDKLEFNQFLKNIETKEIIIGKDFRYGKDAIGTVEDLTKEFKTKIIDSVVKDKVRISSTKIKAFLTEGNIEAANEFLGYSYTIRGEVIKGNQIGRKIGFPTLNIDYKNYKIPRSGVYITKTIIDNIEYRSITNIGINPSINLQDKISLETHVLDFNNQIYGKIVDIKFLSKIRNEIKFNSKDKLIKQLEEDKSRRLEYND